MDTADRFTRDDARISVIVRGTEYQGWVQSEVVRSIEAITGTFSVPTALVPGQVPPIKRGDEVQVRIGNAVVITGYVLAAEPFYRGGDCGLRVTGRDRTGDLVRCSAIHRGGQWRNAKLSRIVSDLAEPFGLQVVVDVDEGAPIADYKLSHGETVLDAMARAARLRGVLVTRNDAGNVLLTRAGQQLFKGVIRRGWNVIEMEGIGSDENRHSHYIVYGQSNVGPDDFAHAKGRKAQAVDADITRYLPLIVNAEGNTTQADLQALADHTARVRRGHSLGLRYVIEGWTFEGQPWPLNQRVRIYDDVAGLDGAEWLIAAVRHTCTLRGGDITELTVRPIEAYDVVPLKSRVVHRGWGHSRGEGVQGRGPGDGAKGGQ